MKTIKLILITCCIFIFLTSFYSIYATNLDSQMDVEAIENDIEARKVEINFDEIATNFNNSVYTQKLKDFGITINAVQKENDIILSYNGTDYVTFTNDPATSIMIATYPLGNEDYADVLCAVFVDVVSTMQGNEAGDQLPYYFGDAFCYSYAKTDGVAKDYISTETGSAAVECQINAYIRMNIPTDNAPIDESTFNTDADNLVSDSDYFIKYRGLVLYKTIAEDGTLEVYMGQPHELTSLSDDSVKTFLSIFFDDDTLPKEKIQYYWSQNYEGFSSGEKEFDGVKIQTDITELPVQSLEALLISNDMKYAKLSIDREKFEEEASKVEIPVATTKDKVSVGEKAVSAIFIIIVVAIVGAIIAEIVLKKVKK